MCYSSRLPTSFPTELAGSSMVDPGLLLGVDAGGSFTEFVLADRSGRSIASGRASGANVTSLGVVEACRVLGDGINDVLGRGNASMKAVHTAVLGVAGVDREPQRSGVERWLATTMPQCRGIVVMDVELVLAAGTPSGRGLAVVSGTGSVVLARDASGRTVKVGAKGPIAGDPGSGHAIGLAAIGTGRFQSASQSPAHIAALVRDVVAAADQGDTDAIHILQTAGRDLAEQAAEAFTQIGWRGTTAPCALGGGVVVNVSRVREAFAASARGLDLYLEPLTLVPRPVEGAIAMAVRLAPQA
jgi:N-acetylglucosamine kinase-like BadF-type ATPase